VIDEEDEEEAGENEPLMNDNHKHTTPKSIGNILSAVEQTPTTTGQLSPDLPTKNQDNNIPYRPSNAASELDKSVSFTLQRGTTPLSTTEEPRTTTPEDKKLTVSTTVMIGKDGNSFLGLPEPYLGPHFAGSDTALKNFVIPSGVLSKG
jgi:hypothetical protein